MLSMASYEPMAQIIPEGVLEPAKVRHFVVTKELEEYSAIRAIHSPNEFVRAGTYAQLLVRGSLVMSDTQMEQHSNFEFLHQVDKRAGSKIDVLVAGLGLGLVLVPVLRLPHVRSVLVVEQVPEVVTLVLPHLLEHLGEVGKKLDVVQGDIFTWKAAAKQRWDVIYFDIWAGQGVHNLDAMSKLKRRFARRKNKGGWMAGWEERRLRYLQRAGRWR